jgi:WD40 repeat protein
MDNGRQLLIAGENSIALLDLSTDKTIGTRRLGFRIASADMRDGKPLLFDHRGGMHLVNSLNDITDEKVPVQGQVTAFAINKSQQLTAYGMADGTIWLVDKSDKAYKLVGHLSQVTKMLFDDHRLYSSSYDGKLLFWFTGTELQIRPITLFQGDDWLLDFTNDSNKENIWIGDADGKLTEYLISLDLIQERLKNNVVRDLTQEEWNYYIGKSIPFRSFLNNGQQQKKKGGQR